jgi:hypothetical protein
MDWWPWVALVFLVGVLFLFSWPRVICPLQRERGWRALAARTGLTYQGRSILGVPRPGRLTGSYRERECSLFTYRAQGVEPRLCLVLALQDRARGTLAVLWQQRAEPPFQVRQSQPEGLADALLAQEGPVQRLSEAAQGVRSACYHLELSGHVMRFEQRLGVFCAYRSERYVAGWQAILDALCDLASVVERLPRQPVSYGPGNLAAW